MISPSKYNNHWSLKNAQQLIEVDSQKLLADNDSQLKRQNDVLKLIHHLARCQILFSVTFIIYGILKFEDYQSSIYEPDYARMCAASLVAGCLGSMTGFLGLWAVYKFHWRGLMVAYLVAGILGSVAYLLLLIRMAAWMGTSEKYDDRAEKSVSKNNPDADSTTVFYVYLMALLLCVGAELELSHHIDVRVEDPPMKRSKKSFKKIEKTEQSLDSSNPPEKIIR
uniref:Transmembrane protein n=1 Tax=Romanomermis culicivorax TaxID=13658 RepID=A0A915K1S2_ROMCU